MIPKSFTTPTLREKSFQRMICRRFCSSGGKFETETLDYSTPSKCGMIGGVIQHVADAVVCD